MAAPFLQNPAFTVGELAPGLFGRSDLARFGVAATTFRNGIVRYQGGASSRAGTKFVGFSKQTGRDYPPRLIPFQFNINQGLALEFGHEYMRVIQNGAFVTEDPVAITGITQANPAVVSTNSTTGALTATANTGAVSASYETDDLITLAGGTFTAAAILRVTNTTLKSLSVNGAGTGYAPADTITLAGGTQTTPAVVTVNTTKVVALPTIVNAGAGGTPGPATVVGTTGTGTPFQAMVTIDGGGVIISVDALTVAGSYTVNPTVPAAEPVTGGGLVGAELGVVLGVSSIALTTPGVFTANAAGSAFTQASTSGAGTGATFVSAIFSPNTVTVENAGAYSAFPANPVAQASTTGGGLGATFTITSGAASPFSNGDWVVMADVQGMIQVNGETYVVGNVTATTFELFDVYGNTIDSTAFGSYVSGGTASRIYTLVTPYSEVDLPYLKYTQSNDVMSLCLLNQETLTEYLPLDLARNSNTDWEFLPIDSQPVDPPTTMSGAASSGGSTFYKYVVTAVDPENGNESLASPIASINGAVNIAATAGTITLTWSPVSKVKQYNVYKATPATNTGVPVGSLFGFAGSAYGTQFIDSNIIADFAQVPPKHQDPFSRGIILGVDPTSGGVGYTTISLTISSATGNGAILTGVIVGGALSAVIVENHGHDYLDTDTVVISGDGAGAAATLSVGPQTGTYPSTVAYFQQRRVYANTINRPNTYFMSQPGAPYTNFDSRLPTIDTDAIIGNPWAVQLNGIQFMEQKPGGLIAYTGKQAWQLTGAGGSSFTPQPITPSSQDAQPQAFNGCSQTIAPVSIDNESIYYDPFNGKAYDFSYQFAANVFTGNDLTLNSSHLFTGFMAVQTAWCREPYKVMWQVRDDGGLLSLTYLKQQEIAGWSRNDTNGLFKSVCSVTEPPVDALYLAVQRFPGDNTAYMIERMDNRIWPTVEDAWCVDCGLRLPQPEPDAILTASSATGLGAISGFAGLVGGTGYSSSTTARIVDDNGHGPGTGAVITLTIVGGVITAATPTVPGTGYTYPALVIEDPTNAGSGASATPTLDNSATFTASASIFPMDVVGSVIRMGGGVATVTARNSGTEVVGQITSPIIRLIPNTNPKVPQPAASGQWTLTPKVSSVGGLTYLSGATITGTYDGKVLDPTVVPATGIVTLPEPASAVTLGLGFGFQLQSTYLNPQGQITAQGQRKIVEAATVRVEASRGVTVGTNQPDGSVLSPPQIAPTWENMEAAPDLARPAYGSDLVPLYTGDIYVPITGGVGTQGQVCVEQLLPLPITVLSFVPIVLSGDEPEDDPKPSRQK